MAVVKGNVLGNLSGKLGNLSARTVEGRTILAARPSSFNVNYDPAVVEVRQKFAVTANFAKNISAISTLSEIWKNSKENGISVFNTIFKKNFQFSGVDKPTVDNIITPDGFDLPVSAATLSANALDLEIDGLGNGTVITAEDVDLSIVSLVVYFNPIDPNDKEYQTIKLSKDIAAFPFADDYAGSINFNVIQRNIAAKYQNNIIYLIAASKSADGKVVQYSKTFAQ